MTIRPLHHYSIPTAACCIVVSSLLAAAFASSAQAQPGWVLSHQKISDIRGGFTGILDDIDNFGWSAASLGDLDGDGVGDLAVGAMRDHDWATGRGEVWIMLLNSNGTVKSHQKVSDTEGGFTGTLDDQYLLRRSVA